MGRTVFINKKIPRVTQKREKVRMRIVKSACVLCFSYPLFDDMLDLF